MARQHNHANVICFGARFQFPAEVHDFIELFLETSEDKDERHCRRVAKMEANIGH